MSDIDFTIPTDQCRHSNLTLSHESGIVEYCPKGCDGEVLLDIEIRCRDCGRIIFESHTGHEGCKYGRN